jgi:hypothetical protein
MAILKNIHPRLEATNLEATTLTLQLERSRIRLLNTTILILMALIATAPLFDVGWFPSHESLNPVSRVYALAYEISEGDWYPRWLSLANARQGVPMFNYYSPAAYLIPAYLTAMGIPILLAMKLVVWLIFLVSGIGMYLWSKSHMARSGAFVASILYMYTPYHFVDLYVRGALAEFAALALLPFLFMGIDRSLSGDYRRGAVLVGLSGAAIVLTHNLSALMISPFALLYWGVLVYQRKPPVPVIRFSLLGPVFGLMLSAFYWLPMALEKKYIQSLDTVMKSGQFHYSNHFTQPLQWLTTDWGFGDAGMKLGGHMSLQIGIMLLACAVIATLVLISRRIPAQKQRFGILCIVLTMLGLFMTTAASSFIYETIPGFDYIQFPWRFLGPTSLFLSAYCGLAIYLSPTGYYRIFMVGLIVLATLFFSSEHRAIAKGIELSDDYMARVLVEERRMGDLGGIGEYNPIWSDNTRLSQFRPFSTNQNNTYRIRNFKVAATNMWFSIEANPKAEQLTLPWYYFPGWHVEVDGIDTSLSPDKNGFIRFEVPPGDHQVRVYFGTTGARQAGWIIALLGLGGILFLYRRLQQKKAMQHQQA